MKYGNILFDLDGTLTDPYEGISNSFTYALGKFGITETDREKLSLVIGPPLENSFSEMYGLDEGATKKAVAYYREYFSDRGIFENKLYDGIEDILRLLKHRNKTIILATSKPEVYAGKILEHFEIRKYFDGVSGSNLDGSRSKKEDVISHVLSTYTLSKPETVMVGDRKYDITGARENGIDSVAVGYGYGSITELENERPAFICKTIAELYDLFSE